MSVRKSPSLASNLSSTAFTDPTYGPLGAVSEWVSEISSPWPVRSFLSSLNLILRMAPVSPPRG